MDLACGNVGHFPGLANFSSLAEISGLTGFADFALVLQEFSDSVSSRHASKDSRADRASADDLLCSGRKTYHGRRVTMGPVPDNHVGWGYRVPNSRKAARLF